MAGYRVKKTLGWLLDVVNRYIVGVGPGPFNVDNCAASIAAKLRGVAHSLEPGYLGRENQFVELSEA